VGSVSYMKDGHEFARYTRKCLLLLLLLLPNCYQIIAFITMSSWPLKRATPTTNWCNAGNILCFCYLLLRKGQDVVQSAEALRYKPEGRGFDSGRTMVPGSTQPLREMSTSYVSWG